MEGSHKADCWLCNKTNTYTGEKYQEFACFSCSCVISVYDPSLAGKQETKPLTTHDEWMLNRETKPEEVKVIPETQQGQSQFNPFIKLPNPMENKTGDIQVGDEVEIIDEFAPPSNPKLKSPLIGNVKLSNGDLKGVGLNWTSYYGLSKTLGKDTATWVGKKMKYEGLKKAGKGAYGHIWAA